MDIMLKVYEKLAKIEKLGSEEESKKAKIILDYLDIELREMAEKASGEFFKPEFDKAPSKMVN
jgi:hypothetical protein